MNNLFVVSIKNCKINAVFVTERMIFMNRKTIIKSIIVWCNNIANLNGVISNYFIWC